MSDAPPPNSPHGSDPLAGADEKLIARIRAEEAIRDQVRREMGQDAGQRKSSWRDILYDPGTIKTLLTVMVIPFLAWVVAQGGAAFVAARGQADAAVRDAQARADAARARLLTEQRADISQMTPLIPYFAGTADDRAKLVALRVLGALRVARGDDAAVLAVYQAASQEGAELLASPDEGRRRQGLQISEALAPPTSGAAVESPSGGDSLGPPPASLPTARPARVYIHIYAENQRQDATRLQDALRALDAPVPGIENVARTHGDDAALRRSAQKSTVGVRYYRDADRGPALFAAEIARRTLPQLPPPQLQNLSRRARTGAPGVVEIWLPCGPAQGCTR